MPKKVMFADSPQSHTHQMNEEAFGHSLGPSPSWDYTPQSQTSWRASQKAPLLSEKHIQLVWNSLKVGYPDNSL
jgi:hypothetical protein